MTYAEVQIWVTHVIEGLVLLCSVSIGLGIFIGVHLNKREKK